MQIEINILLRASVGLWSWGFVSPQLLHKVMSAFLHDLELAREGELDDSMIIKLAKLGTDGAYANNMNRDLIKSIGKPNLPSPHSFMAPLAHKVLGYFARAVYVILPHELFAHIYHFYPSAWRERFCPRDSILQRSGLFRV